MISSIGLVISISSGGFIDDFIAGFTSGYLE